MRRNAAPAHPTVIINVKPGKPASRQLKAWGEFLDMLMERAEALEINEGEPAGCGGSMERN